MSFYLYLNFTLSQSLTSLLKETANVRCHTCQNEPSLVTHNNEAVWQYTYKQSLTELQRLASLTLMIWATETTANHGQWLGVYMCVSGVETYASALLLSMSPHRCLHLLLAGLSINSTGYLSSSRFAWLLTQVCVRLRTSPECVLCVCVCVTDLICHLLWSHDGPWQMRSTTHGWPRTSLHACLHGWVCLD